MGLLITYWGWGPGCAARRSGATAGARMPTPVPLPLGLFLRGPGWLRVGLVSLSSVCRTARWTLTPPGSRVRLCSQSPCLLTTGDPEPRSLALAHAVGCSRSASRSAPHGRPHPVGRVEEAVPTWG